MRERVYESVDPSIRDRYQVKAVELATSDGVDFLICRNDGLYGWRKVIPGASIRGLDDGQLREFMRPIADEMVLLIESWLP